MANRADRYGIPGALFIFYEFAVVLLLLLLLLLVLGMSVLPLCTSS